MATATMPRAGAIKLEYGVAECFALKFTTGKNVEGTYGPRVMFTATDDRKLWLDPEDGSDLELRIRELGVQPGELIAVTKVKMPRGGGHAVRVERVKPSSDERPDARFEALLRASIELAERQKREASQPSKVTTPPTATTAQVEHPAARVSAQQEIQPDRNHNPAVGSINFAPSTTRSSVMCAAFMVAIDAVGEAQAYADRKGLKITFTSEDVRATAISAYISDCKGGRG